MVSTMDSGSGGPSLSPGRGTALCSWTNTLLVQCLSPPRCINGGTGKFTGGNPLMD